VETLLHLIKSNKAGMLFCFFVSIKCFESLLHYHVHFFNLSLIEYLKCILFNCCFFLVFLGKTFIAFKEYLYCIDSARNKLLPCDLAIWVLICESK